VEEARAEVGLEQDIQQSPFRDNEADKKDGDRQQFWQLSVHNCISEAGLSHGRHLNSSIIERLLSELALRYWEHPSGRGTLS